MSCTTQKLSAWYGPPMCPVRAIPLHGCSLGKSNANALALSQGLHASSLVFVQLNASHLLSLKLHLKQRKGAQVEVQRERSARPGRRMRRVCPGTMIYQSGELQRERVARTSLELAVDTLHHAPPRVAVYMCTMH